MNKTKILFVCLGNICRSPAAEGIFLQLLDEYNLQEKYSVDSAGTSGHHDGEKADQRMRVAAQNRNLNLESISRKFTVEDFQHFDFIIVMDQSNYQNVLKLDTRSENEHKVLKMTDFASDEFAQFDHVPDPYFGGEEGFDLVLNLLNNCCRNFLTYLEKR
ncbi:MAG: phosphotyrosine protein phosphatase [Halobacteriovoraceae bacterium]|nr:phosphotyrosine protein phosphatase [Halobacteriovoraceae bacterium]|tara:strand:+ start:29132 stop:29611 length:480 start_codon:yes stop_codon:yes gene_type:complete